MSDPAVMCAMLRTVCRMHRELLTQVEALLCQSGDTAPDLSTMEREVLTVVRGSPGRMTTARILDAICQGGRIVSESTTKKALGRLVKLGLLASSRTKPYGYEASGGPAQ